jgi:hypothetical protein
MLASQKSWIMETDEFERSASVLSSVDNGSYIPNRVVVEAKGARREGRKLSQSSEVFTSIAENYDEVASPSASPRHSLAMQDDSDSNTFTSMSSTISVSSDPVDSRSKSLPATRISSHAQIPASPLRASYSASDAGDSGLLEIDAATLALEKAKISEDRPLPSKPSRSRITSNGASTKLIVTPPPPIVQVEEKVPQAMKETPLSQLKPVAPLNRARLSPTPDAQPAPLKRAIETVAPGLSQKHVMAANSFRNEA